MNEGRSAALVWPWIAAGSALGTMARYLAAILVPSAVAGGWPAATLGVNLVGSCFIAFFATMAGPDGRWLIAPQVRQGVTIGFCGGLTTFSAFSLEDIIMLHGHELPRAAFYAVVSLGSWLAAAWFGQVAALRLIRRGE